MQNPEDIEDANRDPIGIGTTATVKKGTAMLPPISENLAMHEDANCAAGPQFATVQPVPMYPPATDSMRAVHTGYVQQVFVPDGTLMFCEWAKKSSQKRWYMKHAGADPADWEEVPAHMLAPRPICDGDMQDEPGPIYDA